MNQTTDKMNSYFKEFKSNNKTFTFYVSSQAKKDSDENSGKLKIKIKKVKGKLKIINIDMDENVPFTNIEQVRKDFEIIKEILSQNIELENKMTNLVKEKNEWLEIEKGEVKEEIY